MTVDAAYLGSSWPGARLSRGRQHIMVVALLESSGGGDDDGAHAFSFLVL